MSNKKVALLIMLVVGIWGTIGYKIYVNAIQDVTPYQREKTTRATDSAPRENYVLSLMYRDPFLKVKDPITTVRKLTSVKMPAIPALSVSPIINWDIIQFKGVVYNTTRHTKMASLRLNQNEYFLKEGDEAEGFILLAIFNDSLQICYGPSKKIIYKTK